MRIMDEMKIEMNFLWIPVSIIDVQIYVLIGGLIKLQNLNIKSLPIRLSNRLGTAMKVRNRACVETI